MKTFKDLKNESGFEFRDISQESIRVYEFPEAAIEIRFPVALNVSKSGGHRIWDAEGVSHYIPSGWLHLFWHVKDGQPNFVK